MQIQCLRELLHPTKYIQPMRAHWNNESSSHSIKYLFDFQPMMMWHIFLYTEREGKKLALSRALLGNVHLYSSVN